MANYKNRITCTNANRTNGISGSRVTFYDAMGEIIDRFEVPKRNGIKYCYDYPTGQYGKRFTAALAKFAAQSNK